MINLIFLIVLLFVAIPTFAADTVRVCTYNLLNYSLSNEDGRTEHFKMIMDTIRPDILICQEVVEAPAVAKFLAEALGEGYFTPTFHDGADTDNAIFIRSSKIAITGVSYIQTQLRDIAKYTLKNQTTDDILTVYSVHLKASGEDSDRAQRHQESQLLYDALGSSITSEFVIVGGDFNFYSPSEPGYITIAGPRALPTLIDPLGNWTRNSPAHTAMYTQSPRTQSDANCGGGTGGGMDDRFDFLFLSNKLHSNLLPGSYTHFGNDGVARLNSSIDSPANTKYSAAMASALRCASDHLPVYADFIFGEQVKEPHSGGEPHGEIRYFDILGREVKEPIKGKWYFWVQDSHVSTIIY